MAGPDAIVQSYGRAMNLSRRLQDEYNAVLSSYDVVMMPTVPQPPRHHAAPDAGSLVWAEATPGIISHIAASNLIVHPGPTITLSDSSLPSQMIFSGLRIAT
ncbi:hypothetical protein C8R43DRAFT_1036878 [Mycena crocata]|nr:hypothetical protein C8R43DRAFT_1036878 [Mycena crocata]